MKKLLILTLTIITLFSCSSNDENLDPLVGAWYPFSEGVTEYDDCIKTSRFVFNENGNFSYIFMEKNLNNECIEEENLNGVWENKGNNNYGITPTGDMEDIAMLTFTNNNNTFIVNTDGITYKRIN